MKTTNEIKNLVAAKINSLKKRHGKLDDDNYVVINTETKEIFITESEPSLWVSPNPFNKNNVAIGQVMDY